MGDWKRAIVVSDAHGTPELLEHVFDHSKFKVNEDKLIFAGDIVDRGPDPVRVLEILEHVGAEILVGNHDEAAMLDFPISEQDLVSLDLGEYFLSKVRRREWKAVTTYDSVLISHAGVSNKYFEEFASLDFNVEKLADSLNERFYQEVEECIDSGVGGKTWGPDILARSGPLWFIPFDWRNKIQQPLAYPQIAGHTPPEYLDTSEQFLLEELIGFHLIKVMYGRGKVDWRYAVIEQGEIQVYENVKGASRG